MQRSQYRTLGQVGQGQFGKVFCAVHRETGQVFALKDLDMQQFPTHKFLRELSYLVSLRHPNIVSFQGIEHHQGGRYLVMDYCEGGTLRELMESSQKITLQLILKLVQDILLALVHAHGQKIIHCDIKPENILLKITPIGYLAKLSDFGIARWTEEQLQPYQSGGYTGSPAYMAPERFYGKYSAASDLYAVGILLYELLVGCRPFSGFPKDLMTAHLSKSFNFLDTIPPSLQNIIEKSLRKLPQRRFTSSQEMLESLRLASQELLSEPSTNQFFLLSSSFCLNQSFEIIEKIPLLNIATALAVLEKFIYLGYGNQLICQVHENKTLLNKPIQEYQLFLEEEIIRIEAFPTGCFVFTLIFNQYSLYYFANHLTLEQQLHKKLSWSANQLISTIDSQEKWIAIALNSKEIQVYSLPDFKLIKAFISQEIIRQIIPFDQSHALVINQSESDQTLLQILNRKGGLFNAFSIPLAIESVTLSKSSRDEVFALEINHPYLGLLIHLKPLKITRIPLSIKPSFILAQSWGYILASSLGKIIVLDAQGQIQGEIDLSAKITAISALSDSQILVATESNNQGYLHQLKIFTTFLEKKTNNVITIN
jgi:serine/threonine protein kinase